MFLSFYVGGRGVSNKVCLLAVAVVALMSGYARGETSTPAPTVSAVEFKGLQRITRAEVLSVVGSRKGTAYRAEDLSRDIKRLDALGYFYYVSGSVDETPEGLKVIFEVLEKPYLAYVQLKGATSFKKAKLLKQAGLVEDDFLDPYAADTAAAAIAEFYHSKGYASADVSMTKKTGDKGVMLTFNVFEGPRTRIKAIKFKGNKAFNSFTLTMKTKTRAYFPIVWPGVLDDEIFERDLETLQRFYRANGYLDAVVTADKKFDEKRKWLTLTVIVEEGALWHVRNISVTGNHDVPEEELREVLEIEGGQAYRREDMRAQVRKIEFLYGDKGYIEAHVEASPTYSLAGQLVDVDFVIREGKPFRVGRVDIRGNVKTKDKVVRREVDLYPGELFSRRAMEEGKSRLFSRRLFKQVDLLPQPSETEGARDLVIRVEEGPTASLRLGAGISSNQGLIGNLAFKQSNFDLFDLPTSLTDFFTGQSFVGAGQIFELTLEPGTTYSKYRVSFREPYLFDQPITLSTTLFYFDSNRYDYDEKRLGGQLSLGRRFKRALSVQTGVRLEAIDIDEIDVNAPSDVFEVAGSNFLSAVHVIVGYNKVQHMHHAIPYGGYKVSAKVENAGTIVGGDFDFLRFVATAEGHHTIYEKRDDRHVISVIARAGIVEEMGDSDDVPIFERFYAGGFRSVRGFAFRSVGPYDMGEPIGGKLLTTMNAEYCFPLFGPTARGVLFWDVGSVFAEPGDFEFDGLRTSVGVGLRLYSDALGPMPISLDFAFPLNAEDEDDTSPFSFSMGTVFF